MCLLVLFIYSFLCPGLRIPETNKGRQKGGENRTSCIFLPHSFFNWLEMHNNAAAASELAMGLMRRRAALHLMKLSGLCLPCGLVLLATRSTSSSCSHSITADDYNNNNHNGKRHGSLVRFVDSLHCISPPSLPVTPLYQFKPRLVAAQSTYF